MSTGAKPMLSTPAKIRGSSMAEGYAQQRADQELEELLSSNKPGAPYKAFASGLAAGATIPLLLQSSSVVAQIQGSMGTEASKVHLAHWIQQQGASKEVAHQQAAGVYKLLQTGAGHETERVLKDTQKPGWIITGMKNSGDSVYGSKDEAVMAVHDLFRKDFPGKVQARTVATLAEKVVQPIGGGGTNVSVPSGSGARRVLDVARESFESAGKKAPSFLRVSKKVLPGVLAKALPGVATLGLAGGLTNVIRTQKKRREARKLLNRYGASQ